MRSRPVRPLLPSRLSEINRAAAAEIDLRQAAGTVGRAAAEKRGVTRLQAARFRQPVHFDTGAINSAAITVVENQKLPRFSRGVSNAIAKIQPAIAKIQAWLR